MVNVKNTMLSRLADMLAPHYCCACGKIGTVLCGSCKYDIIYESFQRCTVCLGGVTDEALCGSCRQYFEHAWVIGPREEVLERLVDLSKFESIRGGCKVQAELLSDTLPSLPLCTTIVPVPTIARHVRQRGYGHTEKIAAHLGSLRQRPVAQIVKRINNHVQHGASRAERFRQAAQSYRVDGKLDPEGIYVLIDDVYTTGATMQAVATVLKKAGAGHIWVAVTTRQMN